MNESHAHEPAHARVLSRRPILWTAAPGPDEPDRTPHVRAASGVAWVGARLLVAQDDASYLALVDPATARARALPLPHEVSGRRRFEGALGNKGDKLDLEAVVTWYADGETHALALGSGSTPARERWAHATFVGDAAPRVRLVDASEIYRALRDAAAFSGSELNVEGAVVVGERLRLFQRGNGRDAGRGVVDATVDLGLADVHAWLAGLGPTPAPARDTIVPYALGALEGVRLTFTDATTIGDDVWFLAAAEDSPDTYDDGRVVGSVIGRLDARGALVERRVLVDADGRTLTAKTEGLVAAGPGRFWVVVDTDDPARPAELWEVALQAP